MSVIEAALMRTAQASFGLLGVYLGQKHCMFNVDGGERGVLFQRFSIPFFGPQGVVPSAYLPGTYLMFPWLQEPTVIDVKARPKFEKAVTATKDLQSVNIGVRILHRPLLTGDKGRNGETMDNDKTLTELYRKFGVQYDERILPSIMNEVMKTTVAQYNAEELLTKREAVSAPPAADTRATLPGALQRRAVFPWGSHGTLAFAGCVFTCCVADRCRKISGRVWRRGQRRSG
jgi:prohibitin 1